MRYYESLYIVNPNFEQSRLDEAMKTVSEKISEYGFKVINHFEWGKRDWHIILMNTNMVHMYYYTLKPNL